MSESSNTLPTRADKDKTLTTQALAEALAAFGVLVWRCAGEGDVFVEVRSEQGPRSCTDPLSARIVLDDDPSLPEALQRAFLALNQGYVPDRPEDGAWIAPVTFLRGGQDGGRDGLAAVVDVAAGGEPTIRLVNPGALCPAAADRVEPHFRTLLAAVRQAHPTAISWVAMLSDEERRTILEQWSGPPFDPGLVRDELLHEIFEARADAGPDRPALVCAGERMTYGDLERKSNQMAQHLRAKGVGPGALVAILLPRSMDVYVAMLGILKAGAAYVPLDCEYPPDRVAYILHDCRVHTLVSTSQLAEKLPQGPWTPLLIDRHWQEVSRQPSHRLARAQTGAKRTDLCYVIYTSGSTGRPKGVQVEHRSACNLVRAEERIFTVRQDDRVYQGFCLAFDASVEEIWLALAAGATLVVATAEAARSGPALSGFLTQAGVTVFSTVPTQLSMMQEDPPSVRLLIVGGETCTQDLVRRWCRPGRRMVNTYGPTEGTVIATYGDCRADAPVTIGRPAPNYRVYILDRHVQPVPAGVAGELYIGGLGVARGYVGRPDLTAERFVLDPFTEGDASQRLYRTGDLARWTPDGQIEFLGRADTQVKLRGFRIELSEIESVLMERPEVLTAAAAVREDSPGARQIVAYLVPRDSRQIDEGATRTWLRGRLPAYMVPSLLEVVPHLPRLPSGKVDRRNLPAPRPRQAIGERTDASALTPRQRRLSEVWETLFCPATVGLDDDFFLDLGGHSLLAARMVSQLRRESGFEDLAVPDVYKFPTIRAMAAELDARHAARPQAPMQEDAPRRNVPTSAAAHRMCGIAQVFGLYFVAGMYSLQWLAPYLTYSWMVSEGYPIARSILLAMGILLGLYPAMLVASIAIKWLLIGRYKPGRYRLWGFYYFRWWLVNRVLGIVPVDYLSGTPLLGLYYRLMGARIGANVYIETDDLCCFDVISIGDDTSIGGDTTMLGYTVQDGMLHVGAISVGRRCFVGARCVLSPGATMEDDARLEQLSLLPADGRIPRGQTWIGSPARPLQRDEGPASGSTAPSRRPGLARRALLGLAHAFGVLLIPAVHLSALLPGVLALNVVAREYGGWWMLALAPVVAISFIVLLALEIAAVKWLLLGRVRPGRYPVYGWFYVRKWFVDQLMDVGLDLLGPLYATVYLAPWYRLLGCRLGRLAEVSTVCATSPDLLRIDDESFIADCASLGAAHVEGGFMTILPTRIGRRSFVGNSASVPPGTVIGENSLIGCLSAPPLSSPGAEQPDTSWCGSPALFLPQRQTSQSFAAQTTFRPTRRLWAMRAFIEFFRVTLPATFFVAIASVMVLTVIDLQPVASTLQLVMLFPVLYLCCGIAAAMIVVLAKWILMGVYRPAEKPLWSTFVWRTELLTAMHEHLADPFLVSMLEGTPLVGWFFWLMGARIGSRVYMETTQLTEFDLIRIGDGAMLNLDCTVQTHLFEDRVMKMSTIDIGAGCSVGAGSIVLYDTRMEDGASLGDLSLLMKGEVLPSGTRWEGSPARRVGPSGGAYSSASPGCSAAPPARRGRADANVEFLLSLGDSPGDAEGLRAWVLDLDAEAHRRLASITAPPDATSSSSPDLRLRHDRRTVSQALTRLLASRYLDVPPERVRLVADAHGKPAVTISPQGGGPLPTGMNLSVAHRENVYLAAVSPFGPVGVDVEVVRADLDSPSETDGQFSPGERRRIESLPVDQRATAFCKCWTAKEAFVKAIGLGVSFGLDQVETELNDDGSVRLARINGKVELAAGWNLVHRVLTVAGKTVVAAVVHGR